MSDDDCGGPGREEMPESRHVLSVEGLRTAHLDRVFEVLSSRWRRYVLYYLCEMPGQVVERDRLVEAVRYCDAADRDTSGVPSRDAVARDLHHDHLPRLDDAGVIEYDRRQGTVRYDGRPSIEEWVDHAFYKETGRVM